MRTLPKPGTKPHLSVFTRGYDGVIYQCASLDYVVTNCVGGGEYRDSIGFGSTPAKAYTDWQLARACSLRRLWPSHRGKPAGRVSILGKGE